MMNCQLTEFEARNSVRFYQTTEGTFKGAFKYLLNRV